MTEFRFFVEADIREPSLEPAAGEGREGRERMIGAVSESLQTAEGRFLMACLVSRHYPAALAEAAMIAEAQTLDWGRLWQLIVAERCVGLFHQATRTTTMLPPALSAAVQDAYFQIGVNNTLRFRELTAIIDRLEGDNIDVVLLKGVALAQLVYGNLALRPMMDIDVLIRREHAEVALEAAAQLGYERTRPELSPGLETAFENEVLLHHRDRPSHYLEFHWGLFDSNFHRRQISEEFLWSHTESIPLLGRTVSVLTPEVQLLHLCGHLVLHHRRQGLLWWQDITELIVAYQDRLEWDRVISDAQETGLVLSLQRTLLVAAEQWHCPIPASVLAQIMRLRPTVAEREAMDILTAGERSATQRLLADLSGLPDRQEQLRFLYHNVFPSHAYMDERYTITRPGLRPFYYVRRWLIGLAGWLGK